MTSYNILSAPMEISIPSSLAERALWSESASARICEFPPSPIRLLIVRAEPLKSFGA